MALASRSHPDPHDEHSAAGNAPSSTPKPKNESFLALPPSRSSTLTLRDNDARFVDATPAAPAASQAPPEGASARDGAVLRGLKDLQQLQKQTLAVLEAVKTSLDDIQQVLRSPEATRGMEKQRNAVTLLAKGFAREAVEQAQGAVALLPANPESHLLLSLSLAADQQFDLALAAARKGLALFDRRSHPLAIEAGLLHALAALGCGVEAVERWASILDGLPLPVLFDHLARIASCFPTQASGGGEAMLDDLLNRRLMLVEQNLAEATRQRVATTRAGAESGKIDLRPDEIPAPTLFAGLDAARDFHLTNTHRGILSQIARRLQLLRRAGGGGGEDRASDAAGGEVIKYLTECVIPLGNRGLDRVADTLGRAALRRLYHLHADAMTLHRALGKLEMAGSSGAVYEVSTLLNIWRRTGNKVVRAKRALNVSALLMLAGLGVLIYVLWGLNAIKGTFPTVTVAAYPQYPLPAIWIGPAVLALGTLIGGLALLGRTWKVPMPANRSPLTREELAYLNENKRSLRTSR